MLPICLFLESYSSTRPQGQQFLVGAHHQSVRQSPFAIQSLRKTLKTTARTLIPLKKALIVSHATFMINPCSVHVERQPRTVALWRNRLHCRLPLRLLAGNSSILRCYLTSRENDLEVVILWTRTKLRRKWSILRASVYYFFFSSKQTLVCVEASFENRKG